MTDRRPILAKVHCAKRDLRLDDDTYRDLLERVTGKRSAAECSTAELGRVLDELRSKGWTATRGPTRAGTRKLATSGQASKIRALWLSLYQLGEVKDPSEAALSAFVRRMTGVEALQWLTPDKADTAIDALRGWCERIGFVEPTAEELRKVNEWRRGAGLDPVDAGFLAKMALLEALWRKLLAAGAFSPYADEGSLGEWLRRHGAAVSWFLSPDQITLAIEELGGWLRRVIAKEAAATA